MRVISDIMAIAQKCVFKKHKIFTGFRPAMVSPECNYNGESVCGVCKYVSHWSNLTYFFKRYRAFYTLYFRCHDRPDMGDRWDEERGVWAGYVQSYFFPFFSSFARDQKCFVIFSKNFYALSSHISTILLEPFPCWLLDPKISGTTNFDPQLLWPVVRVFRQPHKPSEPRVNLQVNSI